MNYELLKSQKKFLEIPHDEEMDVCVYQGGFGSGKTWAGSLLGVLLALKFPGIMGLVGAKTYSLVRDTTLLAYFEHLENFGMRPGKDFIFNKSAQKLSLKNGSRILFRHFEDPNSLKSLNLGFIEIEEMSDIPYSTFKMLLGRMRQKIQPAWKAFKYRIFGHTNPETRKGWIYETFALSKKPNFRLIQAPSTENIHLPKTYLKNMENLYDENYYKVNVLGHFGDFSNNLVVKNFSDKNVRKIRYREDLPLHISCDFNVDPMCWVLAFKDSSRAYFFDEIILENTTTVEACAEFSRRYPKHRARIVINGDASGDNRSCTSEYTNYILMRRALENFGYRSVSIDIRAFNPPIKNRIAAFNCLVKTFKGARRLYIDPKCEKLLYNINNLSYREGTSILDLPAFYKIHQNPEVKFLGHPFDAASYLVEYYFPIS